MRAFLAVLVLALAAGPLRGEDPPVVEVPKSAEETMAEARPLFAEAERAFAARDWSDAEAAYVKVIEALGDEAALAGWRDQARYNLACAQARAGNSGSAAASFAKCIEGGLRPIVAQDASGKWRELPGLTLEHLLADADLDSIRREPAYVTALKPLVAAGAPVIEFTRPDTSSLVPAVIVLAADGEEVERALPVWRVAAKDADLRVALVAVAGPVRATPKDPRWILRDGDERWAVAKIREALDLVAKDVRVDPRRVYLAGIGERPGEAAWAAALAEPVRLAGFAAPAARFHAAWHADAIAALPKTWRVAIGATDEAAAKLLKDRGIEAKRVERREDEAKFVGEILDALLAK